MNSGIQIMSVNTTPTSSRAGTSPISQPTSMLDDVTIFSSHEYFTSG